MVVVELVKRSKWRRKEGRKERSYYEGTGRLAGFVAGVRGSEGGSCWDLEDGRRMKGKRRTD